MITIISDDTNQRFGQKLYEEFCQREIKVEYISAADVDVKPCFSCEGCTYKTYGKCIVRDDGDLIYPKLLNSEKMIVVTPIKWGGYSFKTKRIMDKCALIGERNYYVKNKELVKRMQGKLSKLYTVGVKDNCDLEEKEVFTGLVAENISIMDIQGNSYVVGCDVDHNEIKRIVEEMSL